jgi:hypothetical protein
MDLFEQLYQEVKSRVVWLKRPPTITIPSNPSDQRVTVNVRDVAAPILLAAGCENLVDQLAKRWRKEFGSEVIHGVHKVKWAGQG